MLRLIRWALWLPTWQPAICAPCHPDAGDDLQAPSTHDDTEDRAEVDRVWARGKREATGKRRYDGTPPAQIEAYRPTGRRNRPHEGCALPGKEAGPLATRACVNRVARAHRPDGKSQQPEDTDMTVHVLKNDKAFQTMQTLQAQGFDIHIHRRGADYDLTAYRRETAHGSHERAARVGWPQPRRQHGPGGGDLPPAA